MDRVRFGRLLKKMEGMNPEQLYQAHQEEVEEIERLSKEYKVSVEEVLGVIEKMALEGQNPRYVLEVLKDPELPQRLSSISRP
ncbi:hypothetical protein ACFLRC_03800 [Candidatus Altiarchaeota archaeon]